MKICERITDWYLTRKTGKSKAERDWEDWYNLNVNYRSGTVNGIFKNFEYIIEVDFHKFITDGGLAWVPVEDARKYFWPERALGNNCVWRIERVLWDQWMKHWRLNDIGGEDRVFVATNSPEDAMMITLLYT